MTCSTIPAVPCLVCGRNLEIRNSTGRKSGKPFLMLICLKMDAIFGVSSPTRDSCGK